MGYVSFLVLFLLSHFVLLFSVEEELKHPPSFVYYLVVKNLDGFPFPSMNQT